MFFFSFYMVRRHFSRLDMYVEHLQFCLKLSENECSVSYHHYSSFKPFNLNIIYLNVNGLNNCFKLL